MLDTAILRENYSGIVKLRLRVDDCEYDLTRTGPGYIEFRHAVDLPPCRGELITTIDDRVHRWPVNLPDGADASMNMVPAIPV